MEISKLKPANVWAIFEEILRVPRPSKKEGKIRAWLVDFAVKHGLEYATDKVGNVVIRRPGEGRTVVVQSHMDMVCEKNEGTKFDFDRNPIEGYIDGEWVRARGTTLGGDDGIGMAAALALLISDEKLPPIEALFTVDEETGLTGAFGLGEGMLTGKLLINLDSEDEGEIFIGCAGGVDTLAEFTLQPVSATGEFYRIDVRGLRGGHSGDDIDKGGANANKLIARFLAGLHDMQLCNIDGGNLRNAIPREGHAVFATTADPRAYFEQFARDIRGEFGQVETELSLALTPAAAAPTFDAYKLISALHGVQNGVLAMSAAMPGLVETSTNLASVKQNGNKVEVVTSQRSSIDSARWDAAKVVANVLRLGGGIISHSDGYPGWKPNPDSNLLKISVEQYRRLFNVEPKVRAIHAGLECGLFLEKYPALDMISIGPTIRGVHSPDERLEIATVDKFWRHLLAVIHNI